TPQYFHTPDRQLTLVLARPRKETSDFASVRRAATTLRTILKSQEAQNPGITIGLTGLPILETDEMIASDEDSFRASWLALAGVTLLYIVVYRGVRYPALTISTLVIGTIFALGWATLTVGHLNILSAAFAVMIIGIGDYGVLWVAHYDEERRRGNDHATATRHTAAHAGPGILVAAVVTSLAFFTTMLADFPAVAELGWIAGSGVLACALATFTVLPALLALLARRQEQPVAEDVLPFVAPPRDFLPGWRSRPRLVLLGTGLVLFSAAAAVTQLRYDANLLHMQAVGLDSVRWEEELIEHSAGATWDIVVLAPDAAAARDARARLEATPGIGRVIDASALLPTDVPAKATLIDRIHFQLRHLPTEIARPIRTDPAGLERTLRQLLTRP
ncbi:MAG: MMPL family transporter, partial [Gemmataceae bacterium]